MGIQPGDHVRVLRRAPFGGPLMIDNQGNSSCGWQATRGKDPRRSRPVKVALVGQPNSGKSTLFNAVAGYRSLTSNFAGTTVEYTHGEARVGGKILDLIDLPGLYSLNPTSPVEEVSRNYLLGGDWDVIVNVLDASQLARSLELTLELLDLESPLVLCLNMMDEAARKGMTIDTHALELALGVPVVEAIGGRGRGILETFCMAQDVAASGKRPHAFIYAPEAEGMVEELAGKIAASAQGQSGLKPKGTGESAARNRNLRHSPTFDSAAIPCASRRCSSACCGHSPAMESHENQRVTAAVAVLHVLGIHRSRGVRVSITHHQSPIGNTSLPSSAFPGTAARAERSPPKSGHKGCSRLRTRTSNPEQPFVEWAQAEIAVRCGQPADAAISAARHAACLTLFERVARITRPKADWREQVDRVAMHPVWGYAVLMGVFLGFFRLIFDVGKLGEDRILNLFDVVVAALAQHMNPQGAMFASAKGAVLGTAGAVAIVLPYLLPFLVGLAILEDIGYLSRVGYLMDAAMHRLGLHGTATLPILVGYGCSVPAVMATRISPPGETASSPRFSPSWCPAPPA